MASTEILATADRLPPPKSSSPGVWLSTHPGNLYISEINSVVRKVDANGIINTVAGNVHLGSGYGGDGNVATAAMLDEPWGLAIDNSGNLLIADFVNNRIRKVGP